MNSIKQVTSGLSSSLFLAFGLTRLAEKTDPLFNRNPGALVTAANAKSCEFTTGTPCEFTPNRGI